MYIQLLTKTVFQHLIFKLVVQAKNADLDPHLAPFGDLDKLSEIVSDPFFYSARFLHIQYRL